MLTHLVFDLETLSTKPNSVILSIGAAAFKFESKAETFSSIVKSGFYAKVSVKDQLQYHRRMSQSTIDWWKEQGPEAKEVLKAQPYDKTLKESLEGIGEWIKTTDYDPKTSYIWCRGNYFDFPILESAFDDTGVPCPYNTWKIRDIRTMIDVLTGDTRGKYDLKQPVNEFIAHNALHDAAMDAMRMKEIFQSMME